MPNTINSVCVGGIINHLGIEILFWKTLFTIGIFTLEIAFEFAVSRMELETSYLTILFIF